MCHQKLKQSSTSKIEVSAEVQFRLDANFLGEVNSSVCAVCASTELLQAKLRGGNLPAVKSSLYCDIEVGHSELDCAPRFGITDSGVF